MKTAQPARRAVPARRRGEAAPAGAPGPPRAGAPTAAPGGLSVVYRPLAELVPYARNARVHSEAQLALLRASLVEFGWTNPMLVADRRMIAGHGRLAAALALAAAGIAIPGHADPATGPTIDLSHLTATQRRAYVLADNRIPEGATWDTDLLKLEAADLQAAGVDLAPIGFSPADLDGLFGAGAAPPPVADNPAPAGEGVYKEQYGVIAMCRDEDEQAATYVKLRDMGLAVKVVAT